TERLSDSFEQSAYELVGIGGRQHVLSGFVQQLQQALGTALRAFRGRNRKRVADARRNALGRQRSFGQIIRDACLHQLDGNVLVAAAREGDDRRTRSGSPYLGKKGKAVDAGQIVIEENAVVRARAYLVERVQRALGFVGRGDNAGLVQITTNGKPVERVIVDDQHAQRSIRLRRQRRVSAHARSRQLDQRPVLVQRDHQVAEAREGYRFQ